MAQKASKIEDVKRSDKVTPSATSRPLIVSNGPTMSNDPMMAPSGEVKNGEAVNTAVLGHAEKVIKPIDGSLNETGEETTKEPDTTNATATPAKENTEQKLGETEKKTDDKPAATEVATEADTSAKSDAEAGNDTEAVVTAEEAAAAEARARREQELEALIVSEKYAVPIDAVQRKRSRIAVICLCILAILLALALLDVVADVGIVKVPASVPHTHLFSK